MWKVMCGLLEYALISEDITWFEINWINQTREDKGKHYRDRKRYVWKKDKKEEN